MRENVSNVTHAVCVTRPGPQYKESFLLLTFNTKENRKEIYFKKLNRNMIRFLQRVILVVMSFAFALSNIYAQSPNLIKFDSNSPDGKYKTGDEIHLRVDFDEWLGLGSTVTVLLNTGDEVTLKLQPREAEDILDKTWGTPGKRNATMQPSMQSWQRHGVYRILELEGKGGHTENKGKLIIAGGFVNYEESEHDNLVVVDENGQLLQGFGDSNSSGGFNSEVRWVEELQDGGLLVTGCFLDYGGMGTYDYMVKFSWNPSTQQFEIDKNFMNNLTGNNKADVANGFIPYQVGGWGKPQNGAIQDADGSIYIVGGFNRVGGHIRNRIAKLSATGVVDPTFKYWGAHDNLGAGTTRQEPGYGQTLAFDPDLEKNGSNDLWFGTRYGVYRISKETGIPTLDISTLDNNSSLLGKYNYHDRFDAAPDEGVLAITVMPEPDEFDITGKPGPGGILVTGIGPTSIYGWQNIIALQNDLTVTPKSKFSVGRKNNNPDDPGDNSLLNDGAIDGVVFMRGKMWMGLYKADRQVGWDQTNLSPETYPNYYEGGLLVMNYDGSFNSEFNHLLANSSEQTNTGRPDGNYASDGIGGYADGGEAGSNIISLAATSKGDLMVGGSYVSMMQYTDGELGVNTGSSAIPDDQFITRLKFNRATGYYIPSADDYVRDLEIVKIVDSNVVGGSGEPPGVISMDNIAPEDVFENNHNIAVNMPITKKSDEFLTTWHVATDGETITLPLVNTENYDFYVDWGDGRLLNGVYYPDLPNYKHYKGLGSTLTVNHTYTKAGNYQLAIIGAGVGAGSYANGVGFPHISFETTVSQEEKKILSVDQWGINQWESMENAFKGCINLVLNATDTPNLSAVSNLSAMFSGASSFNSDISAWDVSKVTNMSSLFENATAFNNGGVALAWGSKTGNVTTSQAMFMGASSFNQSVNGWDVAKITNMSNMFAQATLFNNGDLGNNEANSLAWTWGHVDVLTDASAMFKQAVSFNQDISGFKMSKVSTLANMFSGASLFNQDLSAWNVGMVSTMNAMFQDASVFDQDLSSWNIATLSSASDIFKGATLSVVNYDKLLIAWWAKVSAGTAKKNVTFHGGNSNWCMGESARSLLIDNGWGDGVAAGSYDNTNVTGIIDGGLLCSGNMFITEWKVPADRKIVIQRENGVGGAMDISWGDGTVDYGVEGEPTHTYSSAYNVGDVVTIKMNGNVSMCWLKTNALLGTDVELVAGADIDNLVQVLQFGDIVWKNMDGMFAGAVNMTFADTIDTPNVSEVESLRYTFYNCKKFNSSLTAWNISKAQNLYGTFFNALLFNNGGEALNWGDKTALIKDFSGAFYNASAFNQDISSWNTTSATIMAGMFRQASAFNKPLVTTGNAWNVQTVEKAHGMFRDATSFDQDLSSWNIKGLIDANYMFKGATLTYTNYDALLISWADQLERGVANKNVEFEGGYSQYCAGVDARTYLITNGWGDGSTLTQSDADILDGGSLVPNISAVQVKGVGVFQGADAKITLTGTQAGVTYYVSKLPDGEPVSLAGATAGEDIVFNMGAVYETTVFRILAITDGSTCETYFEDFTLNVYQKPDLANCVITLDTSAETKIANGTDAHKVSVYVVDLLGLPISGAEVRLMNTPNVVFASGGVLNTAIDGIASELMTSTVAGNYSTSVNVTVVNPENGDDIAGGAITHNSNPVQYTFVSDVPDASNAEVKLLTASNKVKANNEEFHKFLVSLKDRNGNPVANNEVRFGATAANAGVDKVRFYWYKDGVKTTFEPGEAAVGMLTNAEGTLEVFATSTKAWVDFTSDITYDNGTGSFISFATSPITYSYVSGDIDFTKSVIEAVPAVQQAGKNIGLTISLYDAYNNVCRGETAVFRQAKLQSTSELTSLVTYNGSVGKINVLTDNNGKATIQASSEKAGLYKTEGIAFYNGVEPSSNGKYVNYEFTSAGAIVGSSRIDLINDNSTANGIETNIIKATLVDAYGNLVIGTNVKIPADEFIDWGSGYNTDQVVQTGSDGTATFYGKSTTANTYTTEVFLEDAFTSYQSMGTLEHTFRSGEIDLANSTVILEPEEQIADGVSTIKATISLLDANLNPVTDQRVILYKTIDVWATSSNPIEINASGDWLMTPDANGQVILFATSTVAKDYTTQIGIEGKGTIYLAKYKFIPGPASAIKSKVSVSLNNQRVESNNELTVQLYDANNNKITSVAEETSIVFAATGDVSINGAAEGIAYTHTLNVGDSGEFVIPVTSAVAATYSTAVTLNGDHLSGSPVSYTFTAGSPDVGKSSYEIINNGALIGGAKVTIRVTLRDVNGNPVPSASVLVTNNYKTENFLDFGFGTNADAKVSTNASGVAEVFVSSTKIGRVEAYIAFNPTGWDQPGFIGNELADASSPASFYFIDEYTTVSVAENIAIRAKWYVLNKELGEASSHTIEKALSLSGAKAWYLTYATNEPTITVGNIASIKTGVAGPYSLSFTATNTANSSNKLARAVVVSVVDAETNYAEDKELAIRAVDYSLSSTLALAHTPIAAISNAKVQAWSLSDWSKNDLSSTNVVPDPSLLAAITSADPGEYPLKFKLTDSAKTLDKDVTVTVFDDGDWFITTWEVKAGETITLPTTNGTSTYSFSVDWGDGSGIQELAGLGTLGMFSHTYTTAGIYTIKIAGAFPYIYFNNGLGKEKDKILTIEKWGTIQWESMDSSFEGCSKLTISATAGVPDLTKVTNMKEMFKDAKVMNSATLLNWNVSTVVNMSGLFQGASAFNQDLRDWNVSRVSRMESMFSGASSFEGKGLENWNVSRVTTMASMFANNLTFDRDLSAWRIPALIDASSMFINSKLSIANYDALLISWNNQIELGTAKTNVKFHGGGSKYCAALNARANLVLKGWGDGIAGGDATNNLAGTNGIVDGGSGLPIGTYTFSSPEWYMCAGSTINLELLSSEVGVSYQLYEETTNTAVGAPVIGTGDPIFFPVSPTQESTTYYVVATGEESTCTTTLTSKVTVYVDAVSNGGELIVKDAGSTELCKGSNVTLLLQNYVGNIERWESSKSGSFGSDVVIINNTSSELTRTNLQETTAYRVRIKNGTCGSIYSNIITIQVDVPTVGGIVTGGKTVCAASNNTTLGVVNYVGDIIRWESSVLGDFTDAIEIANTTNSITVTDITQTTSYRAVVQSGVCDIAYATPTTIEVNALSVGGTINPALNKLCSGGRITLSLTGYTGTKFQWQRASNTTGLNPAESDFINIDGATLPTHNTTTLVAGADVTYYYYRVIVENGLCSSAISATSVIEVYPVVETGTLTSDATEICKGYAVTLTLTGYKGEIVRWESINATEGSQVIANTTATYTTEPLMENTTFSVVLSNEGCGEAHTEVVEIIVNDCDRGDAPDTYLTTVANNGPVHYVPEEMMNIYLGDKSPDNEKDGMPSADALSDDNTDINDEDALKVSYETDRSQIIFSDISVSNNTTDGGFLYAWIDLNQDGTFGQDERMSTSVVAGNDIVELISEDYNYTIKPGSYFVRLRVGTVESEVSKPEGLAKNGEIEDHLVCIFPDSIYVNNQNLKVCDSETTVNLNNSLQYTPQVGQEVVWKMANGTIVSDPNNFDVSPYKAGDIKELYYTVEEIYCNNMAVDGSAKLFLSVLGELNLEDTQLRLCKEDAASVNLNALLGISGNGTWECLTSGAESYLVDGYRFKGTEAYNDVTGGDQSFNFQFIPDAGTCMVNSPKVTIIITETL